MDTLGKRIKFARGKVSQDAFSRCIQVSKGSLGFYERDENLPNSDVILKICAATGVTIEWLLTGKGPIRTEASQDASDKEQQPTNSKETAPNSNFHTSSFMKFERALELEREERREIAAENRKLHQEKESLLREIGELKAQIARLETIVTSKEMPLEARQAHAWLFTQNQSATADKPPRRHLAE